MSTGIALVTIAVGLETATQLPRATGHIVAAQVFDSPSNALATPDQWLELMIQRSDGSCCYRENRFSEATMVSLLLSLVYLVRHLFLGSPPALGDPLPPPGPSVYRSLPPFPCVLVIWSRDLATEEVQGRPSKAEETQTEAETICCHPMLWTDFAGGFHELVTELGILSQVTCCPCPARTGVAAMTRCPLGCGAHLVESVMENPFQDQVLIRAVCRSCQWSPCLDSALRHSGLGFRSLIFAALAQAVPEGR